MNVLFVYILVHRLMAREESPPVYNGAHLHLLSVPFLTALFFATHPIHTETVTWIKNRSDLLASLFFMASFFSFIVYAEHMHGKRRVYHYGAALLFFALAVLSTAMALSLPLILLIYTVYFLPGKERKKMAGALVPFFSIALFYFAFKKIALASAASSSLRACESPFFEATSMPRR